MTTNELRALPVGLHHTGTPNLYLQVTKNKKTGKIRRSWIYRYKSVLGTTRSMGLGSFKAISLATAKELAEQQAKVRQQVTQYLEDPIQRRKWERLAAKERAQQEKQIPTLEQATNEYLEQNGKNWSDLYIQKWKRGFQQHLDPILNDIVTTLTKDQVIAALKPVFKSAPRQGKIIQQHLETVLSWCIHKQYRELPNPAEWKNNLEFEFKNAQSRTEHRASLNYKDAPAFYKRLEAKGTVSAEAMRFIMLTATRLSEAINATWDEIDLDNRIWTIPANRMKMKKEFKVPLSDEAIALLADMGKPISGYIFKGQNPYEPIHESSLRRLKDELNKEITIHGLRATFRTWCDEQTHYPHEIKEAALAHAIPSATERAYVRTTMFDKRRDLMNQWSTYITNID